jgi:hypothetical protein
MQNKQQELVFLLECLYLNKFEITKIFQIVTIYLFIIVIFTIYTRLKIIRGMEEPWF